MTSSHVLAGMTALLTTISVQADFLNIVGEQHIGASASDFSGFDAFDTYEPIVYTDALMVLSGNAYSGPSEFTWSGAGLAVFTISPTLIDITADVAGHSVIDSGGFIEAISEVTLTFTVESARLVSWDWFVLATEGANTDEAVVLSGPDGIVAEGFVNLTPGVYTLTAYCSYSESVTAGDGGVFSRFQLTLEQVPTPGALALFGVAGILKRTRRRNNTG